MKLATRLLGFSDQEFVEGGEPAQRQAQAELNRDQQLRIAMTSGCPELARSELAPAHLGLLEHTPTGDYWLISRGAQFGGNNDAFEAFFVAPDGAAVFLVRPASGPKSRAELEQAQVDREQRRNAPKPKPAWMTR